MDRLRLPDRLSARIALLGAVWLSVGLFGGTAVWLGARLDGVALSWGEAARPAVVASLLWVPITLLATWLARRFPVRGEHRARHGGAQLVAAAATSFVLNFAFFAVEAAGAGGGRSLWAWAAAASAAGLRYLHLNAFVYLVIVGLVHVHDARRHAAAREIAEGGRPGYAQRLEARAGGRVTLLDVDDIDWIEADGDYARVHLDDAEHLVSERMKHLEKRLDPAHFVRIHRSHIVNVHRVGELRHLSHGDYEVRLADDTRLRVSRSRRPQLLAAVERARGKPAR